MEIDNIMKPLVSLCILTYNHEKFIHETLEAACAQDYTNLEIIVSDDNSTDNTFSIIQEYFEHYNGHHKILINRNKTNLGLIPHINKCLYEMSHGDYVVLHGGDDVSMSDRVTQSVNLLKNSRSHCVTLNMNYIDDTSKDLCRTFYSKEDGMIYYTIDDYINGSYHQVPGASRAVSRKLLDLFGPFCSDAQTEDTTLNFRALLFGGIIVSYKIGINYRIHSSNLSSFSNLMTKFNPDNIYHQYLVDLDTSLNVGLISIASYNIIKTTLDDWLKFEQLKRLLYANGCFFVKTRMLIKELLILNFRKSKKKRIELVKIYFGSIKRKYIE